MIDRLDWHVLHWRHSVQPWSEKLSHVRPFSNYNFQIFTNICVFLLQIGCVGWQCPTFGAFVCLKKYFLGPFFSVHIFWALTVLVSTVQFISTHLPTPIIRNSISKFLTNFIQSLTSVIDATLRIGSVMLIDMWNPDERF